jgi:hypothetical protein
LVERLHGMQEVRGSNPLSSTIFRVLVRSKKRQSSDNGAGFPRSAPVAAGLAPLDELETDEVPDSLIAEFASLTTPYCWVITEDAVAGYDGAEPSAVGRSGPGHAVAEDVADALTAGRFFRLADGKGRELAIGRLHDPSGGNELAPPDDFGRQNLGALNIEFRAEGDWQAA